MNISEPTPIQERSLPLLFEGRDLIGQARTGSGKTLAFALPMVEKVDPAIKAVQAVVLVPTRELAQQVDQVIAALGKGRGIRTVQVFGGRSPVQQIAGLRAGAQVVVGAPGRVLDLLRQGALKVDRVSYFVLDEADEMLDRGFAPDVERILGFIPRDRQTLLLSATVPEWVEQTASKYMRNPALVEVDTRPEDIPKIDHLIYDVPEGQKLGALRVLLDEREDGESVLVFGRTKHGVKKLAKQLVALGYPAAALQGNLSQNARDVVMADFRARRVPILLATNVAARGLDVDHIGLVINYELPETTDLLTHRVGRTGRMGREGDAVTLLSPTDEDKWKQLARLLRVRIPRKPWTKALPAIPAAVNAIPLYEPRPARGSTRAAAGNGAKPAPAKPQVATAPSKPQPRTLTPALSQREREQRRPASQQPGMSPRPSAPAATQDGQAASDPLDRWLQGLSGGATRPDRPSPRPVEQRATPGQQSNDQRSAGSRQESVGAGERRRRPRFRGRRNGQSQGTPPGAVS